MMLDRRAEPSVLLPEAVGECAKVGRTPNDCQGSPEVSYMLRSRILCQSATLRPQGQTSRCGNLIRWWRLRLHARHGLIARPAGPMHNFT
eukprot:31487-Eustigmatos_ZCMA.PRE.1